MSVLLLRWLAWVGLSVTVIGLAYGPKAVWSSAAWAEAVQDPPEEEVPEGLEVRAKGPVHEAYATPAEDSRPTPIVPQQPPEPIEELPPDQKPDGENVVWIPGYWHWDEDEEQFLWVSGFWRVVPPGRVWVPGWWRSVEGGWQWVPGFWQTTVSEERPGAAVTSATEVEYLPEPPATLEVGPSIPAPTATSFYVPGHWVWRGRYIWRPGFWWEYRPGWVWVPAHYRWTPLGWVFVPGYWDYPLAARGVLFAPVRIHPILWRRPAFVYTPVYVISEPALFGCLFVRRGWGCYFFGDYFGPRYIEAGFSAWCGRFGPRGGFAIGFGVRRSWGYDPLWSYYSLAYRDQPAWINGLSTLYVGRWRGDLPRPPVNLVQQNTIINNISRTNIRNVTNNITVVNRSVVVNKTDVTPLAMVAPLKTAAQLQPEVGLRPLSAEARKRETQQVRQFRELASQRAKLEAKQSPPAKVGSSVPPAVRNVKLEVPADIARPALRQPAVKQPPPPPGSAARPAPPIDPKANDPKGKSPGKGGTKGKVDPMIEPKGKADPKIDPKTAPKGKIHPKEVDSKGKVEPKGDPKNIPVLPTNPKLDPKGKVEPKGDSKGKVIPPGEPKWYPKDKALPKLDPKGKVDPKGDPKNIPVLPANPKLDPKGKAEPKGIPLLPVEPKGKVDPKGIPLPPVNPKLDLKDKGLPKLDPRMIDPKANPKGNSLPLIPARSDPQEKVPSRQRSDPKGMPLPPAVEPKGKVDPKGMPLPSVNPKLDPKGIPFSPLDPRGRVDPRTDPKDGPFSPVAPPRREPPPPSSERPPSRTSDASRVYAPSSAKPVPRGPTLPAVPERGPMVLGAASSGWPPRGADSNGKPVPIRPVNGAPLTMGKGSDNSMRSIPPSQGPRARLPVPPVSAPVRPAESTPPAMRRPPRRRRP